MYMVKVTNGWLNLAAYSRIVDDREYGRFELYRGNDFDVSLNRYDAVVVRQHLNRLTQATEPPERAKLQRIGVTIVCAGGEEVTSE